MNEEDIDYLFLAMENEEYDEVLRYADIEVKMNQDARFYFTQNKHEILSKIMRKIEAGDYDYFYSRKDTSSLEELKIFSDLMSCSSKIDDIKNVIKNAKKMKISSSCVVSLIAGTHDFKYIKEIINNNDKREQLGIKIDFGSMVDLVSATEEPKYIKEIIESKKLEEHTNSFMFPAKIIELIKKVGDIDYIKQYIENADKRKQLGKFANSYDFIELIKSTKDVEYIKSIIDDKEKRKKLGISLTLSRAMDLIKETCDIDYIKKCIEDSEKVKELQIQCYVLNLIQTMKDAEYIKCLINDEEKRKALGLRLKDVIKCIKVLKVEEINDIVNEQIINNTDISYESKRKIKLPENMTIGIEIESEGPYNYSIVKLSNRLEKGWKCKYDLSLDDDGVEIVSPILTGDNEKSSNSIENVCKRLKALGQSTSENCGGHIHFGSEYLTSAESWMNLIEIWGNCEEIFYTISNKEGEIPREGIRQFAQPISGNFETMIERETVQLDSIEDLRNFSKKSQEMSNQDNHRYFGINFQNLGKSKNTIEFRLSNGTIDADTWIENINLFGGLLSTSEELAKIQKKSEEKQTQEDKTKLECSEKIKDKDISEKEKLEFLLELIIPEEDRDIYKSRYKVNNELISQNPEIEEIIKQKTAKESIDVNKIAQKIFAGENKVNGQDYDKNNIILQNNLQKEKSDLEVE